MKWFLGLVILLTSSCLSSQREHEQKWREAKLEDLKQQRMQGLITEADYKILSEEVYRYQNY